VPGGVVAINLLGDDRFLSAKEQSLKSVFPAVYSYSEAGENMVLMGTTNTELGLEELKERAAQLDAVHAFPFPYRELGERLEERSAQVEPSASSSPLLTDANPPANYFDTCALCTTVFACSFLYLRASSRPQPRFSPHRCPKNPSDLR
jgi:hypothetical protein